MRERCPVCGAAGGRPCRPVHPAANRPDRTPKAQRPDIVLDTGGEPRAEDEARS